MYIDPIIYDKRPEIPRTDREERRYDALDALRIPYQRVDHDPAHSVDDCGSVEELLDVSISKNLLLCNRSKTAFYLLMMPGEKTFVTREISKQIGSSRLSFTDAKLMEELLDVTPGSVSVLALLSDKGNRVQLLLDKALLSQQFIGCHPCLNTSSLKIALSDLLKGFLPSLGHEPIWVE